MDVTRPTNNNKRGKEEIITELKKKYDGTTELNVSIRIRSDWIVIILFFFYL